MKTFAKFALAGIVTATVVAGLSACTSQGIPAAVTTAKVAAQRSPAQVFVTDLAADGGPADTPAQVQLVTTETPMMCALFTSGVPIADSSNSWSGVRVVQDVAALNDSHLCGVTITVPPSTWPTP